MNFIDKILDQKIISEYDHANYIDSIDGENSFHMDCSGFVYWCLFQMGYRRALVELRHFLRVNDFIKINRFFCQDFNFVYKNRSDFKYWRFLSVPVSGCICVVVFPDGAGHCMFVDKILNNNGAKLEMRVVDSTRYPHRNDTRGEHDTGIGRGEIQILYTGKDIRYDAGNAALPLRNAEVYFVMPIK